MFVSRIEGGGGGGGLIERHARLFDTSTYSAGEDTYAGCGHLRQVRTRAPGEDTHSW